MPKRKKLTKNQRRQVGKNLAKRLQSKEALPSTEHLHPEQTGRVVGRFGQHADVRLDSGEVVRCHIRRTIESVVCGDWVKLRQAIDSTSNIAGVIEAVQERNSLLSRPDYYDGLKPVASNIDQIIIVSSVLPTFSSNIVDRYLVASEDVNIKPVIVLNKVDLLEDDLILDIRPKLDTYARLGYQVLEASCKQNIGITELADLLKDKTSVFVGQSGVGKSTLINSLLPEANELTQEVSENSGLGQHTTTSAKLLPFAAGGELIDSPGVREFALWHLPPEQVTNGFIEFREYLGGCKFSDCKHDQDPGCLIREAVENNKISKDRFDNYHSILKSMAEQRPNFSISHKKA